MINSRKGVIAFRIGDKQETYHLQWIARHPKSHGVQPETINVLRNYMQYISKGEIR